MTGGRLTPDLCVIGAGSGGLSVAAGAVQMGASGVLIESGKMGGDCLNHGCVPSKALIAAAKHAHAHRTSSPFGVAGREPARDEGAQVRRRLGSLGRARQSAGILGDTCRQRHVPGAIRSIGPVIPGRSALCQTEARSDRRRSSTDPRHGLDGGAQTFARRRNGRSETCR